ncbi:MAG: hypothetical protein ACTJGT_07605 [Microbacteriaceae bacterium]
MNSTRPKRDLLWKLWPWMSWGIALFFTFHGFLLEGGWETLFLLMFSPLIVPALGLLEMLPRFILRKRGHTVIPVAMACIAPLHWALLVVAVLSARGSTDSAPTRSGLSILSGEALLPGVENTIGAGAALLTVATGIALLVLAIVLKPIVAVGVPKLRTAPAVSAALAVALVIATPQAAVWATSLKRDAAGNRFGHVMQMPIEEQVDLLESRYLEAQEELSDARALAGDARWINPLWRLKGPLWGGIEWYSIELIFTLPGERSLDIEAFAHDLAALGYERAGTRHQWSTPKGNTLDVEEHTNGTELRLTTRAWWGDRHKVNEEAQAQVDEIDATSYAPDEFPGFRSVSASWLVRDWDEILWTRYLPYNAAELDEDGGLDAAGLTRAEGLAADDPETQQERAESLQGFFADLTENVGAETIATPENGGDPLDFDTPAVRSTYADGSTTSDHYGFMVGHCFEQPAEPVDWKALAGSLTAEGWHEVRYAEGALAAVHPNKNIGVVYDHEGALCVAARTPYWWGELY